MSAQHSSEHCCETMRYWAQHKCDEHPDPADCPDNIIFYSAPKREFGIRVHDGGSSYITIKYCPWCGVSLDAQQGAPGDAPQAWRP